MIYHIFTKNNNKLHYRNCFSHMIAYTNVSILFVTVCMLIYTHKSN